MTPIVQLQLGQSAARLDAANPRLLIGRDSSACDLAVPETSISRRHAEVFLEGGRVFVRDLGSSNGTWVQEAYVGAMPVELLPGNQVYIGQIPLLVEWLGGPTVQRTQVSQVSPDLLERIDARSRQFSAQAVRSAAPVSPGEPVAQSVPGAGGEGGLGVGGATAPLPSEYVYRRQGSNANGVLLIALKGDTFANNSMIDGYVEYAALKDQTIASILVDLVELHRKGSKKGHVWDRVLVRQGPWKAQKGDVVPLPFQLRVPPGTCVSGRDVYWELRGFVDIDWAFDIEATCPINMRNTHIERIRDALGALDFRIVELEPEPLGQHYQGKFVPPHKLRDDLGIAQINLDLEYLGANLKVRMEVEKTSLFKFDRRTEFLFDLERLRDAPLNELSAFLQGQIDDMMGRH